MPYSSIFDIMLPIILVMLAGFAFGIFRRIDTKPIADLVMHITVPCLIFSSILKAPLSFKDFFWMSSSSVFVVLGGGIITFLVMKLFRIKFSPGALMGSMFMNSGIIAFPIVLSAYGLEALSRAIIYDATNAFLIFTVGIFILVGRGNVLEIFKLPVVYAVPAALLLNPMSFQIPDVILNTLTMVGDASIPIMLLLMGYRLTSIRLGSFGLSLFSSIMRFACGLALSVLFVKVFGLTGMIRNVVLISSCMPSAVNALLVSEEYGPDSEVTAGALTITTLASFFTIPFIISFLV